MCAEEFASFLDNTRKAPMEEKISAFGDIIEKIMQIVLKIPDLVDNSLNDINSKVSNLQNQLTSINSEISTLKSSPAAAAPATTGGSPGGPPGGPPRSPPPPPGAPPGGPGPAPAPARPASPVSLRGAIMGELKSLFAKRRSS